MATSVFETEPVHEHSRRQFFRRLAVGGTAVAGVAGAWMGLTSLAGTGSASGTFELAWGYRGNRPGNLQKPRAITVDWEGRVFLADMTDRIQVFSGDGEFLRYWRLPDFDIDGSTGLSINRDGNLLVADTHFYRILTYNAEGEELDRIISRPGAKLGEYGYMREVIQDKDGYHYTCEYGDYNDRVQVISPEKKFIHQWGTRGSEPGKFQRPEAMTFDQDENLYIADSCNHRIQVFTKQGKLLHHWGEQGAEPGQLFYPTDLNFDPDGNLYVCEQGNHRIQKFNQQGESLGMWGGPGRGAGKLNFPWGVAVDRLSRLHIADSSNHRVQRVRM